MKTLTSQLVFPADINSEEWSQFIGKSEQGALFHNTWWLDAVTPDSEWAIAQVRVQKGDPDDFNLVAGWPIIVRKTRHGLVATGAPFTPTMGPVLSARTASDTGRWGRHHEQVAALVDTFEAAGLAHVEAFASPGFTYWTPLSWRGFSQTTRYTWRIEDCSDTAATFEAFAGHARRNIRKAERAGITIRPGTVDDLVRLQNQTFDRQQLRGRRPDAALLRRVSRAAIDNNAGEVLVAVDADEQIHSAALFVWDSRWTWYLAGGNDTQLRSSGAASLMQWAGIQAASQRGTGYDFEGSMLRHVERFIRGFSARPVPYSSLVSTPSKSWRRAVATKRLLKRRSR